MVRRKSKREEAGLLEDDPFWYKDAVIYELPVRAFYDSNGDGIGDFRGLGEKLDYLQNLGVTALWLLPFYPSPLKDDGYDIADYYKVNPIYGTLADFKLFLREAHRRGLRVITELVLNHTSDQHPWFQRARRARAGSRWRDFYVWSDTPEKYADTRIIFKDFEHSNWSWDAEARAYYWHRFYAHQPDLNFDNPEVRQAMFAVVDFWLELGIDGLRLDAVPYLYEREGTNCENLPETHAFLKELRRHVDAKFKNRMLLAEANQWPEDSVTYFGDGNGDECHMAFHFPVMPRLFMATRMEDRFPVIDILQQTPPIPETSQWAIFLRNHDELTLEMVTDEDRDYMYRMYANDVQARINLGIRRRLAPLLGNHRRKIELLNSLLLSLPGTPVIYYGDEIGMGDNFYLGDRNGVRTPMQWSADRNAGFSPANPQRLYLPVIIDPEYHFETVNVEAQENTQASLLWWMRRLIALRKRHKAFGRGTLEFVPSDNRKVLVFLRRYEGETILVMANLSRFVQSVELDLGAFKGKMPVELFGRTELPAVGERPYLFTIGPHAFYWFSLEQERAALSQRGPVVVAAAAAALPTVEVAGGWESVFRGRSRAALEAILPAYLMTRRWFGGKARPISSAEITETLPIPYDSAVAHLAFVEVRYLEGDPETYVLPLAFAKDRRAGDPPPQAALARVRERGGGKEAGGVLYDAFAEKGFAKNLLEAILRRRRFKGGAGELAAVPTRALRQLSGPEGSLPDPSAVRAEQSNTSVIFGDRLILKLFRRLEEGINPDLEIGRYLSEKAGFGHTPPLAGALEYRNGPGGPITVAVLQGFVPNEGDAWQYTLDALGRYFERALTRRAAAAKLPLPAGHFTDAVEGEVPAPVREMIGSYFESARLLGLRTAELHLSLAANIDDPSFVPEPFTPFYQRSLYQSMRTPVTQVLDLLRQSQKSLPEPARAPARKVLELEGKILQRFRAVLDRKVTGMRTRIHGDYHLGQVLFTGKDFVIIDFEGEPARPISERRIKRSPLRDVAGMLRSFHYASLFGLKTGAQRHEDIATLEQWAGLWQFWVSVAFLKSYLDKAGGASFLPGTREELGVLLDLYLLEKALYELRYELNNRPDWVTIPLQGILQLLHAG